MRSDILYCTYARYALPGHDDARWYPSKAGGRYPMARMNWPIIIVGYNRGGYSCATPDDIPLCLLYCPTLNSYKYNQISTKAPS